MSESNVPKILLVDDEPLVLAGLRRTLCRTFSITCAVGGPPGITTLQREGPFGVVLSDMRMPGMNGIEFITAARAVSRDTVFMMLTGNADQQTAVDAINQGHIFRFLNKPCAPDLLEKSIRAAIRQYELVTAERVLLRDTFASSIKFMSEALELSNPGLFAFQSVVNQVQIEACEVLGIRRDWQWSVAGELCLIGLMTLPGISDRDGLSDKILAEAATIGSRLLTHIPRLTTVVSMIARQREPAGPLPANLQSLSPEQYERVGVQLLRFAVDLVNEQPHAGSRSQSARNIAQRGKYDQRLIEGFGAEAQDAGKPNNPIEQTIPVADVRPGMIIAADVRTIDGKLLLAKDHCVSELGMASLRNFADRELVADSILIRVARTDNQSSSPTLVQSDVAHAA